MIRIGSIFNVVALSCVLGVFACGSDDGDPGSGDDGSGGSGNTGNTGNTSDGTSVCGTGKCEAGQYCDNGFCENGCLTAANCGSGQECVDIDPVFKVGTCKSAPMKDCNAVCEKAAACGEPTDQCMAFCTAASSACISCLADSNCGQGCDSVCQ